jgi:branched-chain amino acid transport system permease protein
VNFAQGEMSMVVAYLAWTIATSVSGNPFIVAAGAMLGAVVLGLLIERIIMRPMLGEQIAEQASFSSAVSGCAVRRLPRSPPC